MINIDWQQYLETQHLENYIDYKMANIIQLSSLIIRWASDKLLFSWEF